MGRSIKSNGKSTLGILLCSIAAFLGIAGCIWIFIQNNNLSADSPAIAYTLMVTLGIIAFTFLLMTLSSVVSILKSTEALKSMLIILTALAISLVVGYVLASGDNVVLGDGTIYDNYWTIKATGAFINSTMILVVVTVVYAVAMDLIKVFKKDV